MYYKILHMSRMRAMLTFVGLSCIITPLISFEALFPTSKCNKRGFLLTQKVAPHHGFCKATQQSRGQFRFCNSIPIPIPVISIPIQFRLRYKIPKAIQFQFQFRLWQFHSNSSQFRNTQTAFVPCYRHYIGIFF